jgi:hypothetical protein
MSKGNEVPQFSVHSLADQVPGLWGRLRLNKHPAVQSLEGAVIRTGKATGGVGVASYEVCLVVTRGAHDKPVAALRAFAGQGDGRNGVAEKSSLRHGYTSLRIRVWRKAGGGPVALRRGGAVVMGQTSEAPGAYWHQ